MYFCLAIWYPYQKENIQRSAISSFAFLKKDGKFVCMNNACIMVLGLIGSELISMNVASK